MDALSGTETGADSSVLPGVAHWDWQFEVMIDKPMAKRGIRMLESLASNCPKAVNVTNYYEGTARTLIMYGAGLDYRANVMQEHLKRGGRVIAWDLGYWDRENDMRMSIDGIHPTPEHIAQAPTKPRRQFSLRQDADPNGPILLVGIGFKSVKAYDLGYMQWEHAKFAELSARFEGKQILWRPKGKDQTRLPGAKLVSGMPIENAMRGCSLVVCRHSNVAVDACIAGIPVECEDGAAYALYKDNPNPTVAERLDFLNRLSWFNWRIGDADETWQHMQRVVQ